MKRLLLPLAFALAGCNPAASGLEKLVEKNPEILLTAIEKNPEAFMRAFDRAAQAARAKEEERMLAEEAKRRAAELRNPLQPVVDNTRALEGSSTAPITIVEYSDFECPYCRRGVITMQELMRRYPGQIRLIMKHKVNPAIHPHATTAARYYEAIALQSSEKASAFKARLFERQEELSVRGVAFIREQAKAVGADIARLDRTLNGRAVIERITADSIEAERFAFTGTPAYIVNGVSVRGAYPLDHFVELIELQLAARKKGES